MLPARWRELFGLIPVSLLVTAGFTAVLITRSESTDEITTTYGLFFLGCCVFAHIFIRARLPDADPYLFPLAAVLAAIGLVMIYRIDEEQTREVRERAAARPPDRGRRRRKLRGWVTAVVVVLVVGAVAAGFWIGSHQFYFVGTDDRGLVALYRGLPYELPFGVDLWDEQYSTGVPARRLPETRRDRVLDHRLRSKGDAVDLIKQVERGELED